MLWGFCIAFYLKKITFTPKNHLVFLLKMKALIITSLVLLSNLVYAQDCTCSSQFQFVKDYFEQNNPAFQKIKNDADQLAHYKSAVLELEKEMIAESSQDRCNIYFEHYIDLLKDNHSEIGFAINRLPIDFS